VVEDAQHDRLEHDRLGERAGDRQQRRVREVQLALPVAVHAAGEAEVGEVGERRVVDDAVVAQPVELGRAEAEVGDRLEHAPRAGDDAEPATARQAAPEHLEHAPPMGATRPQRGLDHRQLVAVGEQRCRHALSLGL